MSSAPIEPNPPLSRNHRLVALTQNMLDSKAQRMIGLAHNTLDIESQAILGMKKTIGRSFVLAVSILLQATGRVVVMGMGKSGHIGRKIAATLASTAASLTASSSTRPTCTTTTGLRFHCAGGPTL